jgi:hypothetical protein
LQNKKAMQGSLYFTYNSEKIIDIVKKFNGKIINLITEIPVKRPVFLYNTI